MHSSHPNVLLIFSRTSQSRYSSPSLDNTIAANRVDGGIVLVEDQIVDRSFMRLELACNFLALNIDEFDLAIAATNSDLLASLVELADVSNCVTCVDVEDFLHHPDVPHFDDSVRVTRRDVLPAY